MACYPVLVSDSSLVSTSFENVILTMVLLSFRKCSSASNQQIGQFSIYQSDSQGKGDSCGDGDVNSTQCRAFDVAFKTD